MKENIGNESETVLWSGACSHWFYIGYWIAGLLLAGAAAAAIYFNQAAVPQQAWLVPAAILIVVIATVAWKRALHRYQITQNRVIIHTGRVIRDSNEIRVKDIRSVNVTKRGLSGLLGIGTIEFSSAATDDAEVTFFGIAHADGVRDMVRQLQSTEPA